MTRIQSVFRMTCGDKNGPIFSASNFKYQTNLEFSKPRREKNTGRVDRVSIHFSLKQDVNEALRKITNRAPINNEIRVVDFDSQTRNFSWNNNCVVFGKIIVERRSIQQRTKYTIWARGLSTRPRDRGLGNLQGHTPFERRTCWLPLKLKKMFDFALHKWNNEETNNSHLHWK